MQTHSISPKEMMSSLLRNWGLIRTLAQREVIGRYKGSMLGIFWSLVTPIVMLTVYTFVFSVVFKARWTGGGESKTEFALLLFAGLIVFNLFAECITRAPALIVTNANYVKKVVFPLEVLPWVILSGAVFHFVVSLSVWLTAHLLLVGTLHWTTILTPIALMPFAFLIMGLSWALSALGVYVRDIGQLIGIAVQVLMFMSPIFYPISALPESFQPLLSLNPLTTPIEMVRDLIYWGKLPSIQTWALSTATGIGVAAIGFAWFQRTRKGFSDVL